MIKNIVQRPAGRGWPALLGLVVVTAVVIPRTVLAQPPSIQTCDAQLGKDANDPGAIGCYLRVAGSAREKMDTVVRHLQGRWERNRNDPHTSFALGHLRAGRMHPDAVELLTFAASGYAGLRNAVGEVLARCSLTTFLTRRGRLSEAATLVSATRSVAVASGHPRLVAWVNTVDAWLAYRQLDYGRALRGLDEVGDVVRQSSDGYLRGSWMSARSAILWALGRWDEARAQYREEAAYHASVGNRYDQATALSNLLLMIRGPEHHSLALETARIAHETGNFTAESAAYFQLTITAPPAEALRHARRSFEAALATGQPEVISRSRALVGQFTLPANRDEAFRILETAIEEARGLGDPNIGVRHRFLKSTMRWQVGSREQAIADSLSLFDAIEALRALPREEDVRAERFGQWRYAYYRLSGHLLAGDHAPTGVANDDETELAFVTAERMRGRMLLDRLDVAGAPRRNESTALASLSAIRAALEPDEALVTYQLSNLTTNGRQFGSWVWTVTRDRAVAVAIPHPQGLAEAVDVFLGLIQRRDGSEGSAAARLYTDYLAPALSAVPPAVTKLLIVPDDALHRMPFGALRDGPGGDPIAARFDLTILPSASIWLRWRQTPAVLKGAPAIVLADPTLPVSPGTAPGERSAEGLAPLPEARKEAAAVARAVGRRSLVLSGDEATERGLKEAKVMDYRLLHFAAHAVIDDARPDRTAVVLAPSADGTDDGRLQVREIVDLPLSHHVVLLSACRSAGGTLVPGEGAFGLAHAFFRAGARAVVATLWTIRDRDAGEAFALVADALGRGETVAAAVSYARRTLAARGEPAAAWAGLVAMGDANLVPFPEGRVASPAWWHVVFTLLLIAAAGGWFIARRQRRTYQKAAAQVT